MGYDPQNREASRDTLIPGFRRAAVNSRDFRLMPFSPLKLADNVVGLDEAAAGSLHADDRVRYPVRMKPVNLSAEIPGAPRVFSRQTGVQAGRRRHRNGRWQVAQTFRHSCFVVTAVSSPAHSKNALCTHRRCCRLRTFIAVATKGESAALHVEFSCHV